MISRNRRTARVRLARKVKLALSVSVLIAAISQTASAETLPAHDALPALEYQTASACRVLDAYPLTDDGSGVAVCSGSTALWGYDHGTRLWSPFTHCYVLQPETYFLVRGTLTCAYVMGYGSAYVDAITVDTYGHEG